MSLKMRFNVSFIGTYRYTYEHIFMSAKLCLLKSYLLKVTWLSTAWAFKKACVHFLLLSCFFAAYLPKVHAEFCCIIIIPSKYAFVTARYTFVHNWLQSQGSLHEPCLVAKGVWSLKLESSVKLTAAWGSLLLKVMNTPHVRMSLASPVFLVSA